MHGQLDGGGDEGEMVAASRSLPKANPPVRLTHLQVNKRASTQRKVHERPTSRWKLHPRGEGRGCWDTIVTSALLYTLLTLPVRVRL